MQITNIALNLFLAATAVAQGSIGVGGRCNTAADCVGSLNCIQGGGQLICSRNLGLGRPCAVNAVSRYFISFHPFLYCLFSVALEPCSLLGCDIEENYGLTGTVFRIATASTVARHPRVASFSV